MLPLRSMRTTVDLQNAIEYRRLVASFEMANAPEWCRDVRHRVAVLLPKVSFIPDKDDPTVECLCQVKSSPFYPPLETKR